MGRRGASRTNEPTTNGATGPMDDLTRRVLDYVADADYQPITAKALAKRLKIGEDDYAEFRSTVKSLIRAGRLEIAKDKSLRKTAQGPGKGNVVGTFRRSAKGFGFVRPSGGTGAKAEQIFIPPDAGRDASTGDEVLVRITRKAKGPGFNAEGRVVQVVSRASGVFVGTYFERDGSGMVKVDGTALHDPIFRRRKPRARKGARSRATRLAGDRALPDPRPRGEGHRRGARASRQSRASIRSPSSGHGGSRHVRRRHPRRRPPGRQGIQRRRPGGTRLDLTGALCVTIDPATARDFDDAITLTRDEKGFWSLGVHIADVSHFVRVGSPLDRTARTRGTSVYLPDRVIPMLPEILSNSLASLQAGQVRYTVSALMEFNAEGVRTESVRSPGSARGVAGSSPPLRAGDGPRQGS